MKFIIRCLGYGQKWSNLIGGLRRSTEGKQWGEFEKEECCSDCKIWMRRAYATQASHYCPNEISQDGYDIETERNAHETCLQKQGSGPDCPWW